MSLCSIKPSSLSCINGCTIHPASSLDRWHRSRKEAYKRMTRSGSACTSSNPLLIVPVHPSYPTLAVLFSIAKLTIPASSSPESHKAWRGVTYTPRRTSRSRINGPSTSRLYETSAAPVGSRTALWPRWREPILPCRVALWTHSSRANPPHPSFLVPSA